MSRSALVWVSGFVAAGLSLQPVFGQARGGTAPTGSTGTSGSTTVPGTSTTRPTTTPSTNPQSTTAPQPIFLTGQVMLDDGTAPTEPVVIERVCHGQPHAEGYTDSRGYFSIQLFQPNSGVLQDASEDSTYRSTMGGSGVGGSQLGGTALGNGSSTGFGQERLLLDCELRAKASGFRSQSIMLANRRPLDPPDVGVILLHRNGGQDEGTTVSAVSLAAPKDAHHAYVKGVEQLKKGKTGDALVNFEKAVESYPDYAAAWYEIGRIELAANDNAAARHAFETAVKADPKFVLPYVELSVVELRDKKWQALADVTDKVIKLNSFDYPQAFYYNAAAYYYLKDLDRAEKSAREADRLDTHHEIPKNLYLLGIILSQRHDYPGAAEKLRAYLKLAPDAEDIAGARKLLTQVETGVAQAKAKEQ
jgi:tetratricopeptide (TPR) repeat protein